MINTHNKNVFKNVGDLSGYENNSRVHSGDQIDQIVNSMKEFGFTNPVLIDENDMIIAGHGRVDAAKKVGLDVVPCIVLEGLSEDQKKAYVIADNQLALNASWDYEVLKLEIDELKAVDFDLDVIGLDSLSISELGLDLEQPPGAANEYTDKVEAPVYTPSGEKPDLMTVYESSKTIDLIDKINASNMDDKDKAFLRAAAYRHTVFDFEQVANYYAHSDQECQELMEDSAMVIIDYEKAITQGFVRLNEQLEEIFNEEKGQNLE